MKIKKYTNGAWADLDKPVKKFATYTDEATTLPLTIEVSATDAVENYQVYGASGGVGDETENLVTETIQGVTISSTGTLVSSGIFNASIAPITVGKTYTLLRDYTNSTLFYAFFTELPAKGSTSYDGNRETSSQLSVTITAPITGYVVVLNKEGKSTVAEGNTAIPYGYKIPLTITSDKSRESIETPLYIGDTQLGENEYLDYQNQKIYKNPIARWTCTFIPRTTPSGNKYVGFTLNWNMLNGAKITTFARMYLGNEVVNPLTEDTPNVIVEEDTLSARESGGTGANARGELGSSIRGYLVYNDTKYYTPTFNFSYDYVAEKGNFTLIFYSYEDEVTPPLPFPTLTTYLGENSIDVDTTTAPDKVVLEYKGWKGIGDPQIYDGGEWKDEPSEDINLVYQLDNAYWSDGYVKDDGTIAPNRPDFQNNEHFAIEPSTTYVLAYESSTLDCEVSWYTENKTFIRTDEIMNNRVCFFTSPSNAKYAILSVPTVTSYLLFAKKSDVNSLPQITNPIDGTNWKQGWIKSDGTINTDSDYAYYDGFIDVSDCSKVFVGHSNLLVTSKYLEIYEMDSSDQKTAYKDEEYIDGTYKEFNLNANTTKLRFSTSRCTDAMIIKSRVYYKT